MIRSDVLWSIAYHHYWGRANGEHGCTLDRAARDLVHFQGHGLGASKSTAKHLCIRRFFYQPPVNVGSNQDLVTFLVGQKTHSKHLETCKCNHVKYIWTGYVYESNACVYVKSVRLHNMHRNVNKHNATNISIILTQRWSTPWPQPLRNQIQTWDRSDMVMVTYVV